MGRGGDKWDDDDPDDKLTMAESGGARRGDKHGGLSNGGVGDPLLQGDPLMNQQNQPRKLGKKKKVVDEKKEGPTSLFILTESNIIRRLTKFLIEWPPFEYTVLLTIIANCVVLAVERPLPHGDKTELAKQLVSQG